MQKKLLINIIFTKDFIEKVKNYCEARLKIKININAKENQRNSDN